MSSSIKSSFINTDEEAAYFEQEQGNSALMNTSLDSVNDHDQNGSIFSSTYDHSASEQKPETFLSAGNRGINKRERKHGETLPLGSTAPDIDSDKQLENASLDADTIASFLSSTPRASVLENDESVDIKDSCSEVIHNEANAPMSEEVKPPPLAGANVMNVILVAAECAPWSKTGTFSMPMN